MESYALPHQSLFPLVCKQDQLIWKDCVFHTRSPQSDFCINICIHKGNIKIVKAGVYHKRLLNLSQSVPSTHEQGLPKINLAFPQIILYKDKSQLGMFRWNTNLVILFFSCESGFFFVTGGSGVGVGVREEGTYKSIRNFCALTTVANSSSFHGNTAYKGYIWEHEILQR